MGMGGVQRTAKFVKYLPQYGWEPIVLTVNPKLYLAKDECLLGELEKENIKIYRTGGDEKTAVVKFEKDSRRKFLSNLSQTFLLPDSKILWKKKALALADKIFSENDIELVYSTAPPYTDFLIAVELKKKYGVPLVLDYRDSWIDCPNNFYLTPIHKSAHKKMEAGVLKQADKIVTINSRIKELIIERYPFVNDKDISVISQGFDPADFVKLNGSAKSTAKMKITYSGSFLNYYTPKYFLDGLALAVKKNPELKNNIEACFIGSFPQEFETYIKKLGLEGSTKVMGYVEHFHCIQILMESDVLWMMINRSERSDLHSTGKLYEYFGAGKPILACVPEGVARESLKTHGAVTLTEPDDSKAISKAILEYYELYKKNALPKPNDDYAGAYDRKKLTGELASIFGSLLGADEVKQKTKDLVQT
jgi:glycosyltransferase involved in cell wall biosynthesis